MPGTTAKLLMLLLTTIPPTPKVEIIGYPNVIDANTIQVDDQRIRLYGIEGPARQQVCISQAEWRCGEHAAAALALIIGNRLVYCSSRKRIRDRRHIAVCHLARPNGPELNAVLVSQGWALPDRQHTTAYLGQARIAKAMHRGIWCGAAAAHPENHMMQSSLEEASSSSRTSAEQADETTERKSKCGVIVFSDGIY